MTIIEFWKNIDETDYEVSTLGRVRNVKTGRMLNGRLNKPGGYYRVNIGGKDEYIHKLVIGTFRDGDRDNDRNGDRSRTYVRHLDKNRANNALSNLEYIAPLRENKWPI